jgi:hypothetical protein
MDSELKNVIIRLYGQQCEEHINEIDDRIAKMLTALLYAGNIGDNPLCKLNRAFENLNKK